MRRRLRQRDRVPTLGAPLVDTPEVECAGPVARGAPLHRLVGAERDEFSARELVPIQPPFVRRPAVRYSRRTTRSSSKPGSSSNRKQKTTTVRLPGRAHKPPSAPRTPLGRSIWTSWKKEPSPSPRRRTMGNGVCAHPELRRRRSRVVCAIDPPNRPSSSKPCRPSPSINAAKSDGPYASATHTKRLCSSSSTGG